jgi:S-adenosylmethionine-diacylgycerolhomoserine-N-methlytransferase
MTTAEPQAALQRYYALHARLYDATRWSFLFGREAILRPLLHLEPPRRILEVGCGTGRNLKSLKKHFPNAEITGVDLSADMLEVAGKKVPGVALCQRAYDAPLRGDFDLVLCSYALTMFNPGWQAAIEAAAQDLRPGGIMAVVDFSHTKFDFFRRWMGVNHVRMEAHLWPVLQEQFEVVYHGCQSAYGGLWEYGMFLGMKR